MKRRDFVKATGLIVGAAVLGGCTPSGTTANKDAADHGGKRHHGEGRPHFNKPMNRATKVETTPAEEEALAKFVVVSDTHLDKDYEPYIDRVQNMFEDIAVFCPDNDAIIVNGDITNHGDLWEYEKFAELAEANGFAYPDDFMLIIGNHDQYDSTEGAQKVSNLSDRFREQAGLADQVHPYYDRTINGVHLIAMGPDRYPDGNWAHFGITEGEVAWLDELVRADAKEGTLSLVFLHEPLYETVRNTMPGDFGHEWSLSSEDNDNLHTRIKKYENLIFFSGHTHALPDTVQIDGDAPLYVGTGSIAYCVDNVEDDASGNADISEYGSLGWEVTVWTTCIRFRMRNFLTHEYVDDMCSAIYQF